LPIDVDHSSVRGAWKAGGSHQVWLALRGASGAIERFGDVLQDMDDPDDAANEGPSIQIATPLDDGFVALIESILDEVTLEWWVQDLARRLDAADISGTLEGRPSARYPDEVLASRTPRAHRHAEQLEPTAFLAWSFDHTRLAAPPAGGWCVAPDVTGRICDHHARWISSAGPQTIVSTGGFNIEVSDPNPVASMLAAALTTGQARALCFDRDAGRGRWTTLTGPAWTTLQPVHGEQGWRWRVAALRDGMVTLAADLDQAFIGPSGRAGSWWLSVGATVPFGGGLEQWHLVGHTHLLADYLLDASGVQVINDAHLARAADLTAWDVTPLGAGHHLVEARDLAPWYATPLPDQDTVNGARADFGPALLTPEIINADPGPPRS